MRKKLLIYFCYLNFIFCFNANKKNFLKYFICNLIGTFVLTIPKILNKKQTHLEYYLKNFLKSIKKENFYIFTNEDEEFFKGIKEKISIESIKKEKKKILENLQKEGVEAKTINIEEHLKKNLNKIISTSEKEILMHALLSSKNKENLFYKIKTIISSIKVKLEELEKNDDENIKIITEKVAYTENVIKILFKIIKYFTIINNFIIDEECCLKILEVLNINEQKILTNEEESKLKKIKEKKFSFNLNLTNNEIYYLINQKENDINFENIKFSIASQKTEELEKALTDGQYKNLNFFEICKRKNLNFLEKCKAVNLFENIFISFIPSFSFFILPKLMK